MNGYSSIAILNQNASLVQFYLFNFRKLNDMSFQLRAYDNKMTTRNTSIRYAVYFVDDRYRIGLYNIQYTSDWQWSGIQKKCTAFCVLNVVWLYHTMYHGVYVNWECTRITSSKNAKINYEVTQLQNDTSWHTFTYTMDGIALTFLISIMYKYWTFYRLWCVKVYVLSLAQSHSHHSRCSHYECFEIGITAKHWNKHVHIYT